jgi:hypothetical protein
LISSTLGDRSGIKWEEFFEAARGALNAADAVMFSEDAVERAAIALGVKQYPMIESFWDDVDAGFRDKCRDQARAVIAALKGDES